MKTIDNGTLRKLTDKAGLPGWFARFVFNGLTRGIFQQAKRGWRVHLKTLRFHSLEVSVSGKIRIEFSFYATTPEGYHNRVESSVTVYI